MASLIRSACWLLWFGGLVVASAGAVCAQAPGLPMNAAPDSSAAAGTQPSAAAESSPSGVPAASPGPSPGSNGVPAPSSSAEVIKLRFVQPAPALPPPTPEPAGLSPTWFWIAASVTVLTASLGGFYALHVRDLYDQARVLPGVSPRRTPLRDEMRTAEVTADTLLVGSLALAVGTALLAFQIDWRRPTATREHVRLRTPGLNIARAGDARRSWW